MQNKIIEVIVKDERYTLHKIPKSNGKLRNIYAPNDNLKFNQRYVNGLLSKVYTKKLHYSATGFRHDYSVITNAVRHRRSDVFFMFDISNFFDTIKEKTIKHFISRNIHWFIDQYATSNITLKWADGKETKHKGIVQGSPASPIISNIVMIEFDKKVCAYMNKKGYTYTRYADDITISYKQEKVGYRSPKDIDLEMRELEEYLQRQLSRLIPYSKLMINKDKTRCEILSKENPVKVCGVYIKKETWQNRNNYLATGKEFNEELMYLFRKWMKTRSRDKEHSDKLKGKLNWFFQVNRFGQKEFKKLAIQIDKLWTKENLWNKFDHDLAWNRYQEELISKPAYKLDRTKKIYAIKKILNNY